MKITSVSGIFKWVICCAITCLSILTYGQCPSVQRQVTISIRTDLFGSETTWGLYNQATHALVASGGPYGNNTTYNPQVCVDTTACYYFTIYDQFSDGICCGYGPGSYSVTYGSTLIGSGNRFGYSATIFGIGSCTFPSPVAASNTTYTPEELVTNVLLGSCVNAFNISYTGAPAAIGYFSNGAALGIDHGLLLTTGNTDIAPGPNKWSDATYAPGTPGDATLQTVAGVTLTRNAASLEFDFISFNDTVTFRYIFASEEYNEFVCSQYNDVFAFIVNGTGYAPNTNVALIPGTATPVAINSVNIGTPGFSNGVPNNPNNCTSLSNTAYYVNNIAGLVTEFDGYTVPLTATMVVVPCETYHIKLVIADVGDEKTDSGIFLEAESFTGGNGTAIITASVADGSKNSYEGCSDGIFTFTRDDTTNFNNPITINFTLSGSATEGTDFQTIPHSVTILPNQLSAAVNIITFLDGVSEGTETVIVSFPDACSCTAFKNDTLFIFDNQPLNAIVTGDSIFCIGESTTLTASGLGSVSTPFQYSWNSGQDSASITVNPASSSTYTVTITDACAGQTATASYTVNVVPAVTAVFSYDSSQCFAQNSFDFINTSSYSGTPTFYWDIGGTISSSTDVMNHTFTIPGIYNVLLVVNGNGCSDSVTHTVSVLNDVLSNVFATICSDSSVFAGGAFQNTNGTYYDTLSSVNGCDSIIVTALTVVDSSITNIVLSICSGDSIFAGGAWQFSSGIYYDVLSNFGNCDSTIVTTLNVLNHSFTSRSLNLCEGDSVFAGGDFQNTNGTYLDTLFAANGCDSIVTTSLNVNDTTITNIVLSICSGDSVFAGGLWQFSSGTYYDMYLNFHSCDSTIITTLNVLNHSLTSRNFTICEGDSVFAAGDFQNISGTYFDTLFAANGCDSIVTTSLTVNDTNVTNIVLSICSGDSVFAGGVWQFSSGTYYDVFSNLNGCDSAVTTALNVSNYSVISLNINICNGDSAFAGGTFQNANGTYYDTLPAVGGCDTVIATLLTINDSSVTNIAVSICSGDSVFAGGLWQFSPGIYTDVFSNFNGCDSTVITTLNVLNHGFSIRNLSICESDSVFAGGNFQNTSGTYQDTLPAANGCDSIVTTLLTVNDTDVINNLISICSGDSIFAGGLWQFSSGTYYDVYTNFNSCDSTVITTLNILNHSFTSLNISICEGDSAFAGGNFRNTNGTYYDTLSAANSCDSVITTLLTVSDTSVTDITISICSGDSVFAAGTWQFSSGIYLDILSNFNSCDSAVITTITVLNHSFTPTNITICQGDSIFVGGNFQNTNGTYYDTLLAANGCDSITTTHLTVLNAVQSAIAFTICNGDSLFVGGTWQSASGDYYDTLLSRSGCDSIIITTLYAASLIVDAGSDAIICNGDSAKLQATGGLIYSWSPADGLSNPNIGNPVAHPTATTTYKVTSYGASGGDLIVNGNFNAGNSGFTSAYTYTTPPNTAEGQYWVSSNSQAWNGNLQACSDHTSGSGNFMMVNGNTAAVAQVWCQTVNVTPGTEYAFSTWIGSLHPNNPALLQFSINGVLIGATFSASPNTCLWEQFYATWNSGLNTTADICIVNQNTAFLGNDFGLDDISFAPICLAADSVTVTVLPDYNDTLNVSICTGSIHVLPDGTQVNSDGVYPITLNTANGCDSIIVTNLSIVSVIQIQLDETICMGDSFFAGGFFQTLPGTYSDVYTATGGCDSIITTNLVVADTFLVNITTSICQGDSLFAASAWQTTSGVYFDHFTSTEGCDSNIIHNLTVINNLQTAIDTVICEGQSYFAGGLQQTVSGTYTDVFTASAGCDSIITTHLTVSDTFQNVFNISICSGDSIFAEGSWQKFSGTYIDYFTNLAGCDSTIITNLVVDNTINTLINISICEGSGYFAGGALQTTPGVYTDTFNAVAGCDSIVTTTLSISDTFFTNITTTICQGDSIFAGGLWRQNDGVYVDSLLSFGGCDSVVTTNLFVTNIINTQADTTICFGDSIFIAGSFQKIQGTYPDTFIASGGCNSIHIVNLSVIQINISGDTSTICAGDSLSLVAPGGFTAYQWSPGGEVNSSITAFPGNYQLMVTDANGCSTIAYFVVNESNPIGLYALPDSARITTGESVQIQINSASSLVSNYTWIPASGLSCTGCSTAIASPLEDIIYTVVATDLTGCSETVTIRIYVDTIEIPAFYIPNAFTPNGDGMNDYFHVYGQGFTSFNLKVFDRWGEKLFETSNPNTGWDGIFRGQPCNPGVYVYYVEAGFINNFYPNDYLKYKKGSVTLIR